MICPITNRRGCPHLSNERTLLKSEKRYCIKGKVEYRREPQWIEKGLYCNNHLIGQSGYVKDISRCPSEIALDVVHPVEVATTELDWMRRRG